MKISKYLALGLLVISLTPVFGQPTPSKTNSAPTLTNFNLNFPGGTPAQLVKAIEKATGKPLNAIIPDKDADVQLPPLKMNDVVAPQLFAALEVASRRVVAVSNPGFGSYSQFATAFGFKTADSPLSDASIWYFHADKPLIPPVIQNKACRFYPLAPYLERGYTVGDITTAIQTGWKMQGDTSPPEISFHKETKLLIAVGEPDKLEVIDDVLKVLQPPPPNPTADFQDRLKRIIKNSPPPSVPVAPAPKLPEKPEAGQ